MHRCRSGLAVAGAAALLSASLFSLPVVGSAAAAEKSRGYIVVLKDSVASPASAAGQQLKKVGGTRTAVYNQALRGYAATLTPAQATALAKDSQVRFVSPQRTYKSAPPRPPRPPRRLKTTVGCETFPDDRQCQPLFIDRVRADRSSTQSGDGKGAVNGKVAVFEGGVAADVPDLNVRGGVDCLDGSPVVPGRSLVDNNGHGTLVAGIIGARDDNQGLVGVAPGTPLWSVQVSDDNGDISDEALLCGMDWLISTRTDNDPGNDIAIANLSLGEVDSEPRDRDDRHCGTVNHDALHLAICKAVDVGITPVVSAGNERVDLARVVPAAYDEAVTVTAMADYDGKPGGRKVPPLCYGTDEGFFGQADDLASLEFSNFARSGTDRRHTLAAPGVCMEGNAPLPFHHTVNLGTSFAAPVVSGALALCIHTHRCSHTNPARNLTTLVRDARVYNQHDPRYGFFGDPHRPIPGHYYGPLIAAHRY
ncbi:S8 family serine peptidase [Streptomyces sp. MZ04]|uniref:S8 family peptidase n=1 Tax=Streptomyces sp. MZ04 TaxID=2559236 RepID=UPI0014332CE4|nr:S8 family serine peptidase [Streptomyces sp. MZ04]